MEQKFHLQPLKTLISIVCAFIGYFAVLSFSYDEMLNFNSLLISYTAGVVAICIMYLFLNIHEKYFKLIYFALIFFSLRMLVGVFHYLYFFEPDYLSSYSSSFDYLAEYVWALDSMNLISSTLSGDLEADNESVLSARELNKNYEMLFFMSLLFYFGGEKVLVVSSFNSLIVIFSAFLVYKISFALRKSNKVAFFCFVLVSMQPMEFISSILARDIFGQFIIIFAMYIMLCFFSLGISKYIGIFFASILSSFVREVYALIPITAYIMMVLTSDIAKGFISKKTFFGGIFLIFLSILGYQFVLNNILYRFLDQNFISLVVQLPVSLVYALVGPFPWTQIFLQPPGYEFHIPQYITSIYNFALILTTISYLIKFHLKKVDYFILSYVFLFFFSGILVYGGHHTTYYSIAIPLLVLFDKDSRLSLFFIRFFLIFMFWVLMNIVYTFVT